MVGLTTKLLLALMNDLVSNCEEKRCTVAVKNILLAYNGGVSSKAAVNAAILMHKKYDAHVTGLLAHGHSRINANMRSWMPKSMRASLKEMEAEANAKIRQKFFFGTADIDPDKLHWIEERGRSNATVAEYARMYDLTVVGQHDVLQGSEHLELHPDQIAIKSGRPVLILPKDWAATEVNEHAVLAWNGRRTATRALADAMQILETKKLITVLTVDTGKLCESLKGIDVETALQRHGVQVKSVRIRSEGRSVGQAILDFCQQQNAGLLVTGTYEHSVFREGLVGGVTNKIVSEAKLPVLMSH